MPAILNSSIRRQRVEKMCRPVKTGYWATRRRAGARRCGLQRVFTARTCPRPSSLAHAPGIDPWCDLDHCIRGWLCSEVPPPSALNAAGVSMPQYFCVEPRPLLCWRITLRAAHRRRLSWWCCSAHQFLPNIGTRSSCIFQEFAYPENSLIALFRLLLWLLLASSPLQSTD